MDVITIGSATRDIFARNGDGKQIKGNDLSTGKSVCFPLGAKLDLSHVEFFVGGGAINTAVTFSNQGLRASVVSAIGDDPEGGQIKEYAEGYGISCDRLQVIKDQVTSFAFVLSIPNGSRTIFRHKGASFHMKRSSLPEEFKAKWLYVNHMAGSNDKLLPHVIKKAKQDGAKIAWNPGTTQFKDLKQLKGLLPLIDLFIVNQEEASYITGVPYNNRGDIFKKLDKLVDGLVIMTRGPEGVEVSDGENIWSAGVLPLPKEKLVDRTGAGDAFGSGFVSSLINHPGDIERAIQFASANATGLLTKWGATRGLLKKRESLNKYGKLKITRKNP